MSEFISKLLKNKLFLAIVFIIIVFIATFRILIPLIVSNLPEETLGRMPIYSLLLVILILNTTNSINMFSWFSRILKIPFTSAKLYLPILGSKEMLSLAIDYKLAFKDEINKNFVWDVYLIPFGDGVFLLSFLFLLFRILTEGLTYVTDEVVFAFSFVVIAFTFRNISRYYIVSSMLDILKDRTYKNGVSIYKHIFMVMGIMWILYFILAIALPPVAEIFNNFGILKQILFIGSNFIFPYMLYRKIRSVCIDIIDNLNNDDKKVRSYII